MAERKKKDRAFTTEDLYRAIIEGAVERVRPKMMTVVAIMASLLPILWSTGTGSEVMKRIAVPLVGGMLSSTILTLVVTQIVDVKLPTIPFAQRPTCSIAEACSAAGFGRTKLYELIDGGAVKAVKIGRRRLVQVPSLLKLLGQGGPM